MGEKLELIKGIWKADNLTTYEKINLTIFCLLFPPVYKLLLFLAMSEVSRIQGEALSMLIRKLNDEKRGDYIG